LASSAVNITQPSGTHRALTNYQLSDFAKVEIRDEIRPKVLKRMLKLLGI